MTKTKKQNSTQVPNGGYSLGGYGAVPPTYSTTAPVTGAGGAGTNYSNVTLTGGAGLTYTTATGAGSWSTTIAESYYTKKPKVEITDKDLVIDGLSLRDFMHSVNERMAIMVPNPKLEEEFEELKALADRYRELEKKLLDQKTMWETLKKTDQ
ncbi:hypothetical protein UFOVP112_380 [uncultured Caudovirales phage]|uniref:Uncharacterized protein n=1 Tax=uncultured Caudovirales phage TaxID=2100421 RepID=A0A6J5L6X0_9CAUD|nr:hypothetical protein UFOVP112_380 [uncultured Caudovirales phage]